MNLIFTLLILSLLIFVHEFGHYAAARIAGVHVKEFAIGFGKKLFSFEKNNTIYSLRIIPLGGFCNLQGMIEVEGEEGSNFVEKSVLWRILIISAGAIMNVLLAIILLFIMGFVVYNVPFTQAVVGGVQSTGLIIQSIFMALQDTIAGGGAADVAGPVRIVTIVGESVGQSGMVLFLAALISINLGIMNLLPVPGLDGSRIIFLLVEAIKGKPVSPKKEAFVHGIGLVFLFAVMVFVTYQDIVRLL